MSGTETATTTTAQRLRTAMTLSVREYADAVGVGMHTAYRAVDSGEIPAIRHGRTLRIPASHVRALLGLPEPQ